MDKFIKRFLIVDSDIKYAPIKKTAPTNEATIKGNNCKPNFLNVIFNLFVSQIIVINLIEIKFNLVFRLCSEYNSYRIDSNVDFRISGDIGSGLFKAYSCGAKVSLSDIST